MIPEKDLVSILTEVHIADGLLLLPKFRYWYSNSDTLSTYIAIIENHGYTKESMDKTMKYYFIKKPKRLIKIYDQVLGKLSEMESRIPKEVADIKSFEDNLWTGKKFYSFPDPVGTDSLWFDLPMKKTGIYTFIFSVTLYPDDQSVHPRLIAYFCNTDSLETGKKEYFHTIDFIKDGQPHTYTMSKRHMENGAVNLRGWFINYDNHPDRLERHARVSNISLTCNPMDI